MGQGARSAGVVELMTILSILFWGILILWFIVTCFSEVSNTVDGALRRQNRKQRRYNEDD